MRIQHNIMAMNAYRNYSNNTSALSKNLEKLSSGYRINRAGDDAAGLAISEKMRAQITGLKTAQKNAKDGISLVQTAEGAMTEVHDMLNRMVELADQSANGTYDDGVDRANLQKEFDALRTEIDRIADSSNFNGKKLLDGSLASTSVTVGNAKVDITMATGTAAAPTAGKVVLGEAAHAAVTGQFSVDLASVKINMQGNTATVVQISISGKAITAAITGSGAITANNVAVSFATANTQVAIGGFTYSITSNGSKLVFTMNTASVAAMTVGVNVNFNVTVSQTTANSATLSGNLNLGTEVLSNGVAKSDGKLAHTNFTLTSAMMKDGAKLKIGNETYVFQINTPTQTSSVTGVANGEKLVTVNKDPASADFAREAVAALTRAAKDNTIFQVGQQVDGLVTLTQKAGDTHDMTTEDKINSYVSMTDGTAQTVNTTGGLRLQIGEDSNPYNQLVVGINDIHVAALTISASDININNQNNAAAAVSSLKTAINAVSSTRGSLGATQNRLEHTINNLSVMQENIQDAESSIRDVDVADEMMNYTKNNILVQSAQAMLAQANQVPQGVLQLLQ